MQQVRRREAILISKKSFICEKKELDQINKKTNTNYNYIMIKIIKYDEKVV